MTVIKIRILSSSLSKLCAWLSACDRSNAHHNYFAMAVDPKLSNCCPGHRLSSQEKLRAQTLAKSLLEL